MAAWWGSPSSLLWFLKSNTIQLLLLREKLKEMLLNTSIGSPIWCCSSVQEFHRGLHCLNYCSLCTLQSFNSTATSRNTLTWHAVVGYISDGQEEEYRVLVDDFLKWSEQKNLLLNVNKTREMVINPRSKRKALCPVSALMRWRNTSTRASTHRQQAELEDRGKKGMSNIYFLTEGKKLTSFSVWQQNGEIFYHSFVVSADFDTFEAVVERRRATNCYPSWIILSTFYTILHHTDYWSSLSVKDLH